MRINTDHTCKFKIEKHIIYCTKPKIKKQNKAYNNFRYRSNRKSINSQNEAKKS